MRARNGFTFTKVRSGPEAGNYRVKCPQCEVLVVNGVPCHESGCPNRVSR